MRLLPLFFYSLILLLSASCYEDNISCLDPDATNYDILADQACPDCCTYPTFSLEIERVWDTLALSLDSIYTDAGGNNFKLIRFRTYLSNLELVAGSTLLPTPENVVEVGLLSGTDTVLTEINANIALLNTTGRVTSTIGRLRVGTAALTQVQGTVGMSEDFTAVYPPSAPASSPLSTQAGLLNFNDGLGYLTASAEYILLATNDTVRVDVRGTMPLSLDFPGPLEPQRGLDLTLILTADYARLFGAIDLAADATTVGTGIRNRVGDWLSVTGAR